MKTVITMFFTLAFGLCTYALYPTNEIAAVAKNHNSAANSIFVKPTAAQQKHNLKTLNQKKAAQPSLNLNK